jgi:hypothetical protein
VQSSKTKFSADHTPVELKYMPPPVGMLPVAKLLQLPPLLHPFLKMMGLPLP